MVIRDLKYTPEDVDCRFCTEFAHGHCKATKCPWIKERIEAGVVSYHEVSIQFLPMNFDLLCWQHLIRSEKKRSIKILRDIVI